MDLDSSESCAIIDTTQPQVFVFCLFFITMLNKAILTLINNYYKYILKVVSKVIDSAELQTLTTGQEFRNHYRSLWKKSDQTASFPRFDFQINYILIFILY